ncbi:nucleotide-binding universal stress UspA family protein [Salinibacterium sp. CAN_S4]|uniref:universal stress protein n=1 Tax=Salinibacterium sp. CAN_S4 TaxID=2787727 RepID=UPI0018EFCFA3
MTRTANYVVAYEATDRGRDAVQLGVALARLTAAELRICLILPTSTAVPAKVPAGASDYGSLLEEQGGTWLREALDLVPPDVTATTHLLWAESTSEGLIRASTQFDSDRIVVGAASAGVLQRFTVGSIANALLHASPVPVALAPRGYVAPSAITRITCAIGTRPGWTALLDSMVAISEGLPVDLRFVTLVEVDAARSGPGTDVSAASAAHLASVVEHFEKDSSSRGSVTTEVAEGRTVEDAVEKLDWRADEIALVGSSRLAQPSKIFLGVTANRMLHSLPVPLIVVPTAAAINSPS